MPTFSNGLLVPGGGPISLIVQLTAISSGQMQTLQDLLVERGLLLVLPYPRRPESMFDGVEMPVVILSSYSNTNHGLVTTRVGRMYGQERGHCLQTHATVSHNNRLHGHRVGKLHTEVEKSIIGKVFATGPPRGIWLLGWRPCCLLPRGMSLLAESPGRVPFTTNRRNDATSTWASVLGNQRECVSIFGMPSQLFPFLLVLLAVLRLRACE